MGDMTQTRNAENAMAKPRSRLLRRRWLLLAITLAWIGLVASVWVYFRLAAEAELRSAIEAADRQDPNWRLEDIEAARPSIPDEKNGALVVIAALQDLPKDWGRAKIVS